MLDSVIHEAVDHCTSPYRQHDSQNQDPKLGFCGHCDVRKRGCDGYIVALEAARSSSNE